MKYETLGSRARSIIYLLSGALWLSGAVWIWLQWKESDSGLAAPAGARACMEIHGAAAMLFLILFGWLWKGHMGPGWSQKVRRASGLALASTAGLLAATAWCLYYLPEGPRDWASRIHAALGLASILPLAWHLATRKRRRKPSQKRGV
jgi:hypothetical protein